MVELQTTSGPILRNLISFLQAIAFYVFSNQHLDFIHIRATFASLGARAVCACVRVCVLVSSFLIVFFSEYLASNFSYHFDKIRWLSQNVIN